MGVADANNLEEVERRNQYYRQELYVCLCVCVSVCLCVCVCERECV